MVDVPAVSAVPTAPPIRGVVFDFHHTLVHGGDAERWLRTAWDDLDREGDPRTALGDAYGPAVDFLDHVWDHARLVDPDSTRDLDHDRHRQVWDETMQRAPGVDRPLANALYAVMQSQWDVYDDTLPVLDALRRNGIRLALLSNVGYDLTLVLERTGLANAFDGVVMSYALGAVKPDEAVFRRAVDALDLPVEEVLMVGDAWRDDAAAAGLGIRTLLLPRTDAPAHGLELVLRLVGVSVP